MAAANITLNPSGSDSLAEHLHGVLRNAAVPWAPYANYVIDYDGNGRVEQLWRNGSGNLKPDGSAGGTGGLFQFGYDSESRVGVNAWSYKTTVTDPANVTTTYYMNHAGQLLLQAVTDTASRTWTSAYRYDADGRLALEIAPSAMDPLQPYNDTLPDLLGWSASDCDYARVLDNQGLVTRYSYYPASDAGGPEGTLHTVALSQGDSSSATIVPQEHFTYADGYIETHTAYEDDAGQNPIETRYDYTFDGAHGSLPASKTITLPETQSPDGPMQSVVSIIFDRYGHVELLTDADGYQHTSVFDPLTGLRTKQVTDAGTGRLNLTTEVVGWDVHGRPLSVKDPRGNYTYYAYADSWQKSEVWTQAPSLPSQLVIDNHALGYTETRTGIGFGDFGRVYGFLTAASRSWHDNAGRVVQVDRYHTLAPLFPLTSDLPDTGYYSTTYGFDGAGRLDRAENAEGTITRYEFDDLGRVVATWIGSYDADWTPQTPNSSMVKISETQYDSGGVGDGNLTQTTLRPSGMDVPPSGFDPHRVTQLWYDWRNRLVATKAGVGDASTREPITYNHLDNLGRAWRTEVYDGVGVSLSQADPQPPAAAGVRARTDVEFDDRSQPHRVTLYSVAPTYDSTGQETAWVLDAGTTVVTMNYHDGRGNLAKSIAPGGLTTQYHRDGAGRLDRVKIGTGTTWLEEISSRYDANGNPVLVTTTQRGPTETRTTFVAQWHDAGNRLIHAVDFGTNGGRAPSIGADGALNLPLRRIYDGNDPFRRTDYSYSPAGNLEFVTDPAGNRTKREFDALGRMTVEIEGYSTVPGDTGADTNRRTEYAYDGLDHQTLVRRVLPNSETRDTLFDYDDLGNLWIIKHPGHTTANHQAYSDTYNYNYLGEATNHTTRGGPQHAYTHDALGRTVSDSVSFGRVDLIERDVLSRTFRFDVMGRLTSATSWAIPGDSQPENVRNEVQRRYDGFGHVIAEYQEPNGVVNTSSTLAVRYNYTYSGGAPRLSRIIYPATDAQFAAGQARSLWYGYEGADAVVGRPTWIADDQDGENQILEGYQYLGLATPVSRSRPLDDSTSTQLTQTFANGGWDRFGQVTDYQWTLTGSGAIEHLQYWYDANSNLLTRKNNVLSEFSEIYHQNGPSTQPAYDKLNEIKNYSRGPVIGTTDSGRPFVVAPVSDDDSWGTSDEGKNQRISQPDDVRARPVFPGAFTDGDLMERLQDWSDQNDDAEPVEALAARFDGWGNLTKVQEFDIDWGFFTDTATKRLERIFSYDALDRRTGETLGAAGSTLYVDLAGNVLEDRKWGQNTSQYVWSPATGELVLRDRDTDNNPGTGQATLPAGVDQRLYVIYDGQGSVSAITDHAGSVVERYFYSPEGQLLITAPNGAARAASQYQWRYLFRGGRQDGQNLYRIGGQEWDWRQGGPLEHDPEAYWNDHLAIKPPSLSTYDRVVIFAVPVAIGLALTPLTAGMSLWAAGALIGGVTGATAGFSNSYAAGNSGWRVAGDTALGGSVGAVLGGATGGVLARLTTGSWLGGAAASRAGAASMGEINSFGAGARLVTGEATSVYSLPATSVFEAGYVQAQLAAARLGRGLSYLSAPKTVADGKLTGYTRHGLNQAIGREGAGVTPGAILDAVKNPKQVIQQTGGRIKYVGQNATVVTNAEGKVITTWPHGSEGLRVPARGN